MSGSIADDVLAIARSLLSRPPILILDEATSALDPESETIIQANMREIGRGRIVISVSHRLSTLVDAGVLEKRQYQDHPARFESRLTDMGRDFYRVLLALKQWGDTWLAEEEGPPVTLIHATCGHEVTPVLTCSHCGEAIGAGAIRSPGST